MFINELPPEVLGEIFVTAAMSTQLGRRIHKGYIVRKSHQWAPLNLVHVCRYWREIALSIQTLWSSFDTKNFRPEALTHWLSFARSSPLHLAYWPRDGVEWGKPVEEGVLKKSKDMLHHLSLCADRWHSLYFHADNFEITEALAEMLGIAASRSPLQRFEIHLTHDDAPPKVLDNLTSALSSFRSLRDLTWIFPSTNSTLPRLFAWHALETVYVHACVEVEDFIQCLMHCTSARKVTFLGISWGNKRRVTDAFKNAHCTLPTLESLTLNDSCDPRRFIQHFTLPSLLFLEIHTRQGREFMSVFHEFLARSQCPLRTFKIDITWGRMLEDQVISCLSTPNLPSVPEVAVSLSSEPKTNLSYIVRMRPDLLRDLPKLEAWNDKAGYNIGWRRRD